MMKSLVRDNLSDIIVDKRLIIGCGTGRCGTLSLSKLLNLQPDTDITHERFHIGARFRPDDEFTYQLSYECNPHKLEHALKRLFERETSIVGDVAFYWINYIGVLLALKPSTKFICLKRNKHDVVESFWMRDDGKPVGGPDLHGLNMTVKGVELAGQYLDLRSHRGPAMKQLKEGTGQNWETYYAVSEILEKKYPKSFKIFPTEALNSEDTVKEILIFMGFAEDNQVVQAGIWENKRRVLFNGRQGSSPKT